MSQPSATEVKRRPYGLTQPCAKCPFRNDIPGYLTRGRVREIRQSLVTSDFPCHLTTTHRDDDDVGGCYVPTGTEMHCAGALILLEKLGTPSQMMRISERLGMYDMRELSMDAPVFDSWRQMEQAQRQRVAS
jgi:hypothetical protein